MLPPVCCPDGLIYDQRKNKCESTTSAALFDPIPCPCCPPGPFGQRLTYISNTGWFYNTSLNIIMKALTWTGGAVSGVYNKCAFTQISPDVFGSAFDPIDCPCCPKDYTWDPNEGPVGFCVGSNSALLTNPIPCVTCVCTPPPPFVCPTCGTSGERITFNFNFNTRNCTTCVPDSFNPPKGKINCFIPNTLIDPDTSGFILKS